MTDDQYLEAFRIADDRYLIGIYQKGQTLYKQQVRSLNIFHLLFKAGKIGGTKSSVAIIGGGVAGLTFAAAARAAGLTVAIYENESRFLHMQYGCEIRKIHPNLYEWPSAGSTFPYARLPVLRWKHGTASSVVKQIMDRYSSIPRPKPPQINYHESFNCKFVEIARHRGKTHILSKSGSGKLNFIADIVIIAVGYGVEQSNIDDIPEIKSYWRNDSIDQSVLISKNKTSSPPVKAKKVIKPAKPQKKHYIVSGSGDGGLMDLFRTLIEDFSYDYVFNLMKTLKVYDDIAEVILAIKEDGIRQMKELAKVGKTVPNSYLYDAFSAHLNHESLEIMHHYIVAHKRYRTDHTILHSTERTFRETLKFGKISMLNAFLAYFFETKEKIVYKCGKITRPLNGGLKIGGRSAYTFERIRYKYSDHDLIIRHGTDKESLFDSDRLPLEAIELERLKEIKKDQENSELYGIVEPRWTYTELKQILDQSSKREYEYFTLDTTAICSGFISVLSSILNEPNRGAKTFRMSLHRVIEVSGEPFFQQITCYSGSKDGHSNQKDHSLGEIHPKNRGNVGLSFFTGQPFLFIRRDEDEFKKLLADLNLADEYHKFKKKRTFLSLPILAHSNPGNSKRQVSKSSLCTNMILYLDAEDETFLGEPDKNKIFDPSVLKLILSAIQGFIHSIERLLEDNQISMGDLTFTPIASQKDRSPKDYDLSAILANRCNVTLPETFNKDIRKCVFEKFYSFDVIYN